MSLKVAYCFRYNPNKCQKVKNAPQEVHWTFPRKSCLSSCSNFVDACMLRVGKSMGLVFKEKGIYISVSF